MLAALARELPRGGHLYEPKWDGFRCTVFRDGDEIDLRSRHNRPLGRYFPELVEALLAVREPSFALDGEIVVSDGRRLSFPALMSRLHPAPARVARLRRETPASFVAFDVPALGSESLCDVPFRERRRALERLLVRGDGPLSATPATADVALAERWLDRSAGRGIDGVVAKRLDLRYEPGHRAMTKVKLERTADCVVAGARLLADRPELGSLLLGLWDGDRLVHAGVASSFTAPQRAALRAAVEPLTTSLLQHPWQHGFGLERSPLGRLAGSAGRWTPEMELEWIPLEPRLVAEVAYEQVDGRRLRHPARFRRWRADREARSCTIDQLDPAPGLPFELLAA
jgi:ATP-dependent DNA ligase